mmetsp:Transcript_12512/g.29869  ORF Transcript_12512/g.29869 Transcript_12512/m.29869 type:complete len:336 (+) Transcript_12512:109-1116(+)
MMITTETFLPLPNGDTYVRIDTPAAAAAQVAPSVVEEGVPTGVTFLLVHGATVPHWQFDRLVPILAANAAASGRPLHRIIRMDLYGHGKSARPSKHVRHDISLFIDQVLGVIQHYRLDQHADNDNNGQSLIALGHSLGAAVLVGVASSFANRRQTIFQHLILSAPMLDFMQLNPHVKIMTIPCVGELVMKFVLDPFLRKRRKKRNNISCKQKLKECFDGTTLLQMFRDRALGDQSMVYQRFGEQLRSSLMDSEQQQTTTRILVLWGSNDKVVNGHHISRIIDLLDPLSLDNGPRVVELERLEGLEHNQLSADPHRCAKAIFSRLALSSGNNPSII